MISSTAQRTTRVYVTEAGEGQAFLVARPCRADAALAAADAYAGIADALSERGMGIVQERIFGSLSAEAAVMAARDEALRLRGISPFGALTYIQGNPPWGEGLAGVLIRAVNIDQIRMIMDGNVPCGRRWRRNRADFMILQNLQGLEVEAESINASLMNTSHGRRDGDCPKGKQRGHDRPRFAAFVSPDLKPLGTVPRARKSADQSWDTSSIQARRMIERAECILKREGAAYRAVVRTWFYLNGMLEWYKEFNEVRNEEYEQFGLMPNSGRARLLLPASTGIEGITPQQAACAMDLIAVSGPTDARPLVRQLRNPHQQDAFLYGSAFSRGAVVEEADVSVIEISGTAAIDEKGISLYPGDIRSQITATLDKVEALIGQEGARLDDICAATVFLKCPEHYFVYQEIAAERGLHDFAAVCVVADVCRDELLFEIDAEAVVNSLR